MPAIKLCFLWHMHQPFYKERVTGEYRLPWVRLHALKDYYGMVKILEEFPRIALTFNLVPSLLVQLEDYAAGTAKDPFLEAASKPAEDLSREDREFILRYFFQADLERVIRRYPRYLELFELLGRYDRHPRRAAEGFDAAAIRDLQVLSQLAWLDEYDLAGEGKIRALVEKGRGFSVADQQVLVAHEAAAVRRVLDAYREAANRGQIELSASAFYHPILPLLCDSNVAHAAHPYISLPPQFRYPEDALEQLTRSREFFVKKFGAAPAGMWPSEGAVSEAVLDLAAQAGFEWTASDSEILARSLEVNTAGEANYRSYRWRGQSGAINMVFRDRRLSDLITLAYPQMRPEEAAGHFVSEVRKSCGSVLESGADALVPIILDGENVWEKYAQNGRPFLRALYGEIENAHGISALKMSEGIATQSAQPLNKLHPGSWVDANFDIWIGDKEDNAAWEQLLQARQLYGRLADSPEITDAARIAAYEELMIAEGSDWCWWYGPENPTANQGEFDHLFRDHLSNVYRLLGQAVPAELGVPIAKGALKPRHEPPAGLIQPRVDGTLTSSREWENAGHYSPDPRIANLHGQRALLQSLRYGSDGQNLFLRVDLSEAANEKAPLHFVLRVRTTDQSHEIRSTSGEEIVETDLPEAAVRTAAAQIYEARISLSALRVRLGDPVYVRLEVLRDGLSVAALPEEGELPLHSGNLAAYAY